MNRTPTSPATPPSPKGIAFALAANTTWGLFPLFWQLFGDTPAVEVVSHRVIWSLLSLLVMVWWTRSLGNIRHALRTPRSLLILFGSALALSLNWTIFIIAVNANRVVESSFGYFICPLVSLVLAGVFLKERLRPMQQGAVALATFGVVFYGWSLGTFPWYAIGLAITFGFYGLLRKIVPVGALAGLFVETLLMLPLALVLVLFFNLKSTGGFGSSFAFSLLFVAGGIITTIPLLWFNKAAKLLPLSLIAFLQYLTPFLQLLIGLSFFNEPFSWQKAGSFSFIWVAIALYLWSATRPQVRQI